MKALFICPGLAAGGAERQWSTLIPTLRDHGIESAVLALNEEGVFASTLRRQGIEVISAGMRNRLDVRQLLTVLRAIGGDFDVIVTRSVNAHVVGSVLAHRLKAAHVATEHSQYDLLPLRRHQRALVRFAARRAAAAVCVSPSQIPPLIGLGYRRELITVIPNAVRAEDVAPTRSRNDVLSELGFPTDCFLAAMVAGLRPEKRPLDFVGAVMRANGLDPRVRGVIVGDGVERPAVATVCAASGGVVRAVGARNDVADLLGACDVACLTSRSEASPVALLEAIALGKPIVATAVGGVPQLVEPGLTGELIAPGDVDGLSRALVKLAGDHDFAARVRTGAQVHSLTRTSFDSMVAAYERALRGAVGGPRQDERPALTVPPGGQEAGA